MIIYITKNLINGKLYIGQKQDNAPKSYIGGGVKLRHAIKKYGKHNFTHTTLLKCDKSQADYYEQFYIWYYDAQNDLVGYNVQDGGSPSSSDISRLKMRISRLGIVFTDIHKKRLSKSALGRVRSIDTINRWRESRSDYKHTNETKSKISNAQIGGAKAKTVCKINPLTGDVVGIYKGGFALMADGYNQSKVSACALGKRKTHKGFIWRYET